MSHAVRDSISIVPKSLSKYKHFGKLTTSFDEPPHVTSETNIFSKITEKK